MASKGTLEIKILGDVKGLKRALDKGQSDLQKWAGGATAVFAGLGAAGGALLVSEFFDAVDRQKMEDRLGAAMGLSPERQAELGDVAGRLYANAYGDSLEDNFRAVDLVASTFGDVEDSAVIEGLTENAQDFAAAFNVDIMEAVNAAGVALRTGLAPDAEGAFDLMTAAAQEMPATMRDELPSIVEEYSTFFGQLGFEGAEAFGVLVDASDDGRFALDKAGDAIKEFTIRATDGSDATSEAFENIGLDADDMANQILAGGDTARDAFDQIVDGLLDIEDPAEQAQTAIALFGTPIEDLSLDQLPDFLAALSDTEGGLEDVEGAATRMGDQLNDNVATKIEEFKRKATTAIETWVQDNVLPQVGQVIDAFDKDGVGGALSKAVELLQDSMPELRAWFDNEVQPFFEDYVVPTMEYLGGLMGTALVNGLIEMAANSLPNLLEDITNVINDIAGGLLGIDPSRIKNPFDFDIDVPNIAGPDAPDFPSPSGGGSTSIARPSSGFFHTGGVTSTGGVAMLAEKERVLSPQQTASFDRLVDMLTRDGQQSTVAPNISVNVDASGGSNPHKVASATVVELREMLMMATVR